MEKIIAIVPKEKFLKVRLCISTITKSAVDVLLIDPEENPNYEEIIKEARAE
ncbi:hypothetical protein IJL65_00320 [bacterium]|nr:hypothetical protein [bacterium]